MGGWREVIEPTALRGARLDDLTLTVEHAGVPLARHPGTLHLEERADGLHWSAEPPRSRQDIVEAVERGDLRAASWRMRVARDSWVGDVRHVESIAELRDVSITANPAYPSAAVELRSIENEEGQVPDQNTTETGTETPSEAIENRSAPSPTEDTPRPPAGSLRVEDRALAPTAATTLADEFRAAGFPGERAEIAWHEFESRAITWSGTTEELSPVRRLAGPLGSDNRWAWPVFPTVAVGPDTTAISTFTQTGRDAVSGSAHVQDIDETGAKPEVGSTFDLVTLPLKTVPAVVTGVPNIYLAQAPIVSVINTDLRLALNAGLDYLVLTALATTGFEAPGSNPLLVSIRNAIKTIAAAGYNADTLIVDPDTDADLDTLRATATAGEEFYIFPAGQGAPSVWNLTRRVSKDIPAPVVVDSQAFGRVYASPVALARFEESSGQTNTSTVRLECNAAFGVERVDAAVRIAAS